MNGNSPICKEDGWTAVAAALKETHDIPPASPDFTQRCLRAALASLPQSEKTELTVVRDSARRWWRVAAAVAALIGGAALAAVGTRAFLSQANDEGSDAATSTAPTALAGDQESAPFEGNQDFSAAGTSGIQPSNCPTVQLSNCPTPHLSPTVQGESMNTANATATLLAAATLATTATAELPRLDSSQFDYKYEMIALPTTEDLDGGGAVDFTGAGSWLTLGTGSDVGTIAMTISGSQNINSASQAGSAGDIWQSMGATVAADGGTGYTIETRLKVSESTGTKGALVLNASTGDSSVNSWLIFRPNAVYWGHSSPTLITNLDATVWHDYRIVREHGTTVHSVYIDGILVAENLPNGISASINRLLLGGANADYAGKAQVAYLRFHAGEYAPLDPNDKSRRKASTDFATKYEMEANDVRISISGDASDWTISGYRGATLTKNGILSVTPNEKQTYWRTTDSTWKNNVTADTAYAVEFAAKINSCTISGGDRTLQFWTASPRATGNLIIGMYHVYWQVSTAMADNILLDSSNNSDGKHIFRITYDGATRHGFTVWRDGVLIGEKLVDLTAYNGASYSFTRFGIPGSTSGGSFDIDYIRWDTTGAWEWKDPPKGFVIVVR